VTPILILLIAVQAQVPDYAVEIQVERVLVDVVARDAEGRFVPGLGSADFVVRVDGRERPVDSVREVHHPSPPSAPPPAGAGAGEADVAAVPAEPGRGGAGPTPSPDALPARHFVFVFDRAGLLPGDVKPYRQAVSNAASWIGENLAPTDRVSLLTLDHDGVRALADGSSPSAALREAIRAAGLGAEARTNWAADVDRSVAMSVAMSICPCADPSLRSAAQRETLRRRVMADAFIEGLDWLADRLQVRPGRKAVILLTPGIAMRSSERSRQRDDIVRRLRAADCAVYVWDTAGLTAPFGLDDFDRQVYEGPSFADFRLDA